MMPQGREWIHWPDRGCWKAFIVYGAWLTCLWIVVYGGACWATSLHSYRLRLHFDVELGIPFFPAAALIYLSLFPMLWLAPFVLQTAEAVRSFAKAIAWLVVLSGIGFLLLPAEQAYGSRNPAGFFGQVFTLADWINLNHNYLPSLHVGMAVVCAYVYGRHLSRQTIALTFWAWAISIAVSTLVLHEHYVADVAAGGLLGCVVAHRTR